MFMTLKSNSETNDIRNFIQITQKCHLFSFFIARADLIWVH